MIKITDALKARVQDHEGLRTSVYLDTLGKKTVGIGHLVQDHELERFAEGVEIPMDEIMYSTVTPDIVTMAFWTAFLTALFGSFIPAIRAAMLSPVNAMKREV